MKQLFLFVRPPRPLWPFNSPDSAFWPPLAFASLAAALREAIKDIRVGILDAPALRMGWRSLEAELARRAPTFVGIGEEAVSCVEGMRLARICNKLGAKVIAGGCFFGQVAEHILPSGLVHVVVHGEGEVTLVELVERLRQPDISLRQIDGISYMEGDAVVRTSPRKLIQDLDRLPFPAYDLLPVSCYGARSQNHPKLAALELGRGCFGSCDFCILWRQMGRFAGDRLVPSLRLKSAERVFAEVEMLVNAFDRKYLGWVDPCFNADPIVPAQLAEKMLRRGMEIGQSAWVRTDAIVRDARSGALDSCVRAGLNELYLGIERADAGSLSSLHKTAGVKHAREALQIIRGQFPEVLAIGSFIYGLPEDTCWSVLQIHRLAMELQLEQFFFIPLTPLPGTAGWSPELWDETGESFREFDFLPSGKPHGRHAILELTLLLSVLFNWPPARLRCWYRSLFSESDRKRRVHRRLHTRAVGFHLRTAGRALFGRGSGLIFPDWYES